MCIKFILSKLGESQIGRTLEMGGPLKPVFGLMLWSTSENNVVAL